jgi:hypothetical protein
MARQKERGRPERRPRFTLGAILRVRLGRSGHRAADAPIPPSLSHVRCWAATVASYRLYRRQNRIAGYAIRRHGGGCRSAGQIGISRTVSRIGPLERRFRDTGHPGVETYGLATPIPALTFSAHTRPKRGLSCASGARLDAYGPGSAAGGLARMIAQALAARWPAADPKLRRRPLTAAPVCGQLKNHAC